LREWWRNLTARQRWGAFLAFVGVGLTVALAYLGNTEKPPAASTQALIALLAILAQVGAVWIFSGDGKADPTLAQRSVARLVTLAERASQARRAAEVLHTDGASAGKVREGVGQLSVHLSYLEEGYLESIDDWRMFHPKAVEQAERRSLDDE
jgi:hypothetical protein